MKSFVYCFVAILAYVSFSAIAVPLSAQFGGGDGSSTNPWQIATAEHLNNIRFLEPYQENAHFSLTADINLGTPPWNQGEGWVPIGSLDGSFLSTFLGNGHTINGLYINRPDQDYQGLFSILRGATIEDLTLSNTDINGNDRVGGLFGERQVLGHDYIDSVVCSGNIHGNTNVGGIGGDTWGWGLYLGSISNCINYASVSGFGVVGGTIGNSSTPVTSCINYGVVSGHSSIGGISGCLYERELSFCINNGSVTGTNSIGGITGAIRYGAIATKCISIGDVVGIGNYIGGISGSIGAQDGSGTLTESYNWGSVIGVNWVGGLTGKIDLNTSSIEYCYNFGNVEGVEYVGGAIGEISSFMGLPTIINNYAACMVTGTTYTGGFVGRFPSGLSYIDYDTCYWDSELTSLYNGYGFMFPTQDFVSTDNNRYIFTYWDSILLSYYDGYPSLVWINQHGSSIPPAAELVTPEDAISGFLPDQYIGWIIKPEVNLTNIPLGFKLYLGTDNPPTNFYDGFDLGNRLQYKLDAEFEWDTTYYWQIVPYNLSGEAISNPIRSFHTASLSLSYPTGNEVWVSGTTQCVRWQTDNAPRSVMLYLSFDGGSNWGYIDTVDGSLGYYYLQVPSLNSNNCLVKIVSTVGNGLNDTSLSTFTISNSGSNPRVIVSYPSASNIHFAVGQSVNISWTRQNVSSVGIDYTIDNGITWNEIVASVNSNSYNWLTPDSPASLFRIRVRSTENPLYFDISNNTFSVSKVELLSPNGNEVITGDYSSGYKYRITWNAPGTQNLRIQYSDDNALSWINVVDSTPVAMGYYEWTVPGFPRDSCLIKLSNVDNPNIYDISDSSFAIQNPIRMISGAGGGFITANSFFTIRWENLDIPLDTTIYWQYSTDYYNWTSINQTAIPVSDESYFWYFNIGNPEHVMLRAVERWSQRTLVRSISWITVTDKYLALIQPCGGEVYSAGSQQVIYWDQEGLSNLNIEFSSDSGATWSMIALSIPAVEGIFAWQTPDLTSDNCLIRLTDTSYQYMQIVSEATFYVHQENMIPAQVTGLLISISDSIVSLSWNAVTESTTGTLMSPDYYIVLYSDDPYGEITDFSTLATTAETHFVHENMTTTSDKMFFRVIAVNE
jgi:hypothetical protein